jgi:CheY-like chemotaxis protein
MARAGQPDLIFLDLGMPGMSGFDVLSKLKADPRTRSIAVVIHTSMRLGEDDRSRISAAAAVVSKEELNRESWLSELAMKLGENGRILMDVRIQ